MSMDVGAAKIRAGQLTQYRIWLEHAKKKMIEYRSQINTNWSGEEVSHINAAIDQVMASLEQAIRELDSIGSDVVRVANVIRAEEIEAERQQKIREASGELNRINEDLNRLNRQKQEVERMLQSGENPQLRAEWENVSRQIKEAERARSNCQSRLNLLRR